MLPITVLGNDCQKSDSDSLSLYVYIYIYLNYNTCVISHYKYQWPRVQDLWSSNLWLKTSLDQTSRITGYINWVYAPWALLLHNHSPNRLVHSDPLSSTSAARISSEVHRCWIYSKIYTSPTYPSIETTSPTWHFLHVPVEQFSNLLRLFDTLTHPGQQMPGEQPHGGRCDPYLQRRAARQETFDFYMVIEAKSKDSVDIRKLSCLRSMRTYNILMIYIYI